MQLEPPCMLNIENFCQSYSAADFYPTQANV